MSGSDSYTNDSALNFLQNTRQKYTTGYYGHKWVKRIKFDILISADF